MLQRCYNTKSPIYHRYGGRGITVCHRWCDFMSWYEDLGQFRPSLKFSMERSNNNGGYWCGNCPECVENNRILNVRWATQKEQCQNREVTMRLKFKDQEHTLGEWADITGLTAQIIWGRVKAEWPIEEILTLPRFKRGKERKERRPDALQKRDLTNQRFGLLTALRSERQQHSVVWHCICDCGRSTLSRALRLIRGETLACRSCSKSPSNQALYAPTET